MIREIEIMKKTAKAKPEVWRDVPGYEGYYQVSDMGRIRSVDRTVLTKNGTFNPEDYRVYKRNKSNK